MAEHVLERLAGEMGKRFNDEMLHASLLLSYVSSVYDVMRRNTSPSPLYRITYDGTNNQLGLKETEGNSYVPEKGAMDIDALDVVLIGNLRGIPPLFEGETGVGKTYVCEGFHRTIFPKENAVSLRLSGGVYDNIFQHFLKGERDKGGMPKLVVDESIIDSTAGMFIDEPNRGDPDDLLQLIDNKLHSSGKYYNLGIRIPTIDSNGKVKDSGRRKKIDVTSAINPSNAKYSGTVELDAAVDNRFLKVVYGNAAVSAGAGLWLSEKTGDQHETLIRKFAKRAAKYLDVSDKAFSDVNRDWVSLYAWITDTERTEKPILYSALEFSDLVIPVLAGDLPKNFEFEKSITAAWNEKLGTDINITETLPESENVKKIHEIVGTFKVPVIFRDITQIKKLADVITTLGNLRDALMSPDPVQAYIDMPKHITLKEAAAGATLLARNKQLSGSPMPYPVINDVLSQYIPLTEAYSKDMELLTDRFDMYDPNLGIKKIALAKAFRNMLKEKGKASGSHVDSLIANLGENATKLKAHISSTKEVRNLLVARSISDILTFAGFANQYRGDVEPMLKSYKPSTPVSKIFEDFASYYRAKREEQAMVMPEIYQHRVPRTLGV